VETTRLVPGQQVMCVMLRHSGRFTSGVSPPTNDKSSEVPKVEVVKGRSAEGPKSKRRAEVSKSRSREGQSPELPKAEVSK
jgi:hypothetical protein